jgi:glycosyltransferase involved in cell wall biosynthesis
MAWQFFITRRQTESHNRRCLLNVAADFAPDVVFVWNIEGLPRSIAVEAESLPNVAVAYWLAGYSPAAPDEFWCYWSRPAMNPVVRPFKSLVSKIALPIMRTEGKPLGPNMRHVAVVSEYLLAKGLADGTLPANTQVIYNGVEIEEFFRPVPSQVEGPLLLLLAGRVTPDKGVDTVIEAVGILAQECDPPNVQLVIAGSGPDSFLGKLKRRVHELDIENLVSFLGWVPREEVPELMARHHVLILPTVYQEPFARVVLEAMASGLLVVSTLTGGTKELLEHEVTGLAFDAGNAQELALLLRRLVTEPGLRQRLAEQGQEVVLKGFSLDNMIQNVEDFLKEAFDCEQGLRIPRKDR